LTWQGHANIDSVVNDLGATAKVITAAALIMVSLPLVSLQVFEIVHLSALVQPDD
jgi:hypothetical protein